MTVHRPTPLAAVGLAALAGGALLGVVAPASAHSGGGSSGSGSTRVLMQDDCDAATFPAEAHCTGDGDTTFDEFVEELLEDGEHGKWRNTREHTTVRHGETLVVRNEGGEPHTFTPVEEYGGSCVPQLNDLLGLGPVDECDDPAAWPGSLVDPGGAVTVEADHLDHGANHFQCLIHPWMRTTVTLR